MSSFRRAGQSSKTSAFAKKSPLANSAKGVKPWTGGLHLVSMGLNDLDNLLGGGQPLGTSVLVQEDRWTRDLAFSLLKYWCAEAISQEHDLIIPTYEEDSDGDFLSSSTRERGEIEDILMSLPRNLHWDKQMKQENCDKKGLDILQEDDDDEEEKTEEGLEIAWQYKKSVQKERLAQPLEQKKASTSNVFCHSYDLSGRMKEQTTVDASEYIATVTRKAKSGLQLFRELVGLLKGKDRKPLRMLLYHPAIDVLVVALPLLMSYIRKHSLPVVVMVYSSPYKDIKALTKLSSACDVLLATEGFSSRKTYPPPPEFRLLQGILTISKICTVTANGGGFFGDISISKKPAAFIYGFKRDRRKLHLSLLHIPPEDYAQGGGSVGSGVRSGAGKKKESSLGCSSNMSSSSLDF